MPAVIAAALTAAVGGQACGGGPEPSPGVPPAAAAELEAIYRARVDSALARYTEADARFMTGMIHHHAQALEMAALAPARAASPDVRRLAPRIQTGQEAEIALMRRWLEDRGLPAPEPAAAGAAGHDLHAPGMLTPEQMQELERATGRNFDRLFLIYMIQHHEGAVARVEQLFATPGAARDASTFRIASGVQVDQRTEIARMEAMLEGLEPRPAR
ncbi:MAG TPA: DUF305 domain-containing protein [Longimicrobiales bacterium]|nr:DUF305 domain-containing protein [Longimicrobiales bacterium]